MAMMTSSQPAMLVIGVLMASLLGSSAATAADTAVDDTVTIDLDVLINAVSPLMNGAHFSPLNHQIQVRERAEHLA